MIGTIVLLCGLLVTQIVTVAVLFRFAALARNTEDRIRTEISSAISRAFTPPAADQPAPVAVFADQLAIIFSARIMQQLRQAASGISSGQARAENAEAEAAVTSVNPALGIIAAMLPKKLRNQMLRNPQMLSQLSLFKGGAGGNGHSAAAGESIVSRIRNQS